jgi:SOS-response transcriptional repressor LexA
MDQFYRWKGSFYVPFHSAPLAAGLFLSASPNWVEQHVELQSDFLLDRYLGGIGMDQAGLAAARVQGDSTIDRSVINGDIVIFQRYDFDLQNGKVVVIEEMGEEEGFLSLGSEETCN